MTSLIDDDASDAADEGLASRTGGDLDCRRLEHSCALGEWVRSGILSGTIVAAVHYQRQSRPCGRMPWRSLPPPSRVVSSASFPRYAPSFGTFQYAFPLTGGVRAFMPPQGLLVIAAALPPSWQVRFVDENIAAATAEDFRWADAVFVSGMHIQQRQIEDICRRAHAGARTAVLGGPSVSACPNAIRISTICMSARSAMRPMNCSRVSAATRHGRRARSCSPRASAAR